MKRIKHLAEQENHRTVNPLRYRGLSLFGAVLVGISLLASSRAVQAQNTGSILGNVEDASGAVIVKASVTATDADHGITRETRTNGSGEFLISSLPVGKYALTVSAASFRSEVINDIAVDANSNVKEVVTLTIGSATETISVEDTSGAGVDPNSATIATLIPTKLIEDMPIDGHNVVALSALLPGVVSLNAPATFTSDTGGPTYSSSGGRTTQNLMLFDGLMWNNLFYNTGVNFPTPNALEQVSVLLNNFKAEYGRNAGSVFNVLTRKGTNTIHGAVWDYLQNQMFNAADYITQVNPKDNQNQFGFTIGGPAPHLRDKLFYFGAYQQLIGHLLTTGSALTMPYPDRALQSDGITPWQCNANGPFPGGHICANFADQADATSASGVLSIGRMINPINVTPQAPIAGQGGVDPSTVISVYNTAYQQAGGSGTSPCIALLEQASAYASSHTYGNQFGNTGVVQPTYMPYDELPIECINPVMLKMVNKYVPLPGPSGFAVTTAPAPTGDKNGLIRIDYIISGTKTLDARYNIFTSNSNSALGVNNQSIGVATYGLTSGQVLSNFGNVGLTWVITPNLLNQTRVGYKRFEAKQFPDDSSTLNTFGGSFFVPQTPALPELGFNTFNLGTPSEGYQDHINEDLEVEESVSGTRGNHNIKVGFSFLRLQYLTRSDYTGVIGYSSTYTSIPIADGMAGLATSVQAQNRLIQGGIQHDVFGYAQDDWRPSPKLTVNLGVRYELPFQWFEPHGHSATFVPGIQSVTFPNAPTGLGFPGDKGVLPSLVPTDFNGLAPRVGVSYDVYGTGRFLIRSGYGVFFDSPNANVVGVGEPFHYLVNKQDPPGGASVPLATYGVDANGNPNGSVLQIPQTFDPAHPVFFAPYSIFYPDPHFRTPYVQAANFGFQYHVTHGGVLDVNYIGKFARKLTIPLDLNPAIYDCSVPSSIYCSTGGASSSSASLVQRVRYAPFNYGGQGIVDILSIGTSSYNALQVQYTQRGGRYLTILSSYTYSKAMDIQTNAQTTSNSVPDVANLNSDYGPSDNNVKHNFTLGWVARFPTIVGFTAPIRAVFNNWVYSGQYVAHTGTPFSVTINGDESLTDEPSQRASFVPGVSPKLPSNRPRTQKVAEWFNPGAFSYPEEGTFSTQSRNSFVGPGYILTNMTLGRDFPMAWLREGMRFNIRAEAFNVFNTPNLANPYSQYACTTPLVSGTPSFTTQGSGCSVYGAPIPGTTETQFARVRSTYGNNANTSTNGRKMQFSMTVYY